MISGIRESQKHWEKFPGKAEKSFQEPEKSFQEPEKHKTPGEVSRESREKFQEIFNIRKRVTVNALYQ